MMRKNMEAKSQMVTCPACGKPIPVRTAGAVALRCPSCRRLVDARSMTAVPDAVWKTDAQKLSSLAIGMKGELFGIPMRIVGWVKYRGEDDEESWEWEEWHAIGDTRSFWIEYHPDEDEYTVYQLLQPEKEVPAELRVGQHLVLTGSDAARVEEVDTGTLIDFDGELDWIPVRGEVLKYADARSGNVRYSIEYDPSGNEVFKGRVVAPEQIFRAFGLVIRLKQLEEKQQGEAVSVYYSAVFGILALFFISLAGYFYISRTQVFASTSTISCENGAKGCAPVVFGPVLLDQPGKLHIVRVGVPNQFLAASSTFDVQLVTSTTPLLRKAITPSTAWAESTHEYEEHDFRLRDSGLYFVSVMPRAQAFSGTTPQAQVTVKITTQMFPMRYPLIAAFFSLVALAVLNKRVRQVLIYIFLGALVILSEL